jgi:hypothetical protein
MLGLINLLGGTDLNVVYPQNLFLYLRPLAFQLLYLKFMDVRNESCSPEDFGFLCWNTVQLSESSTFLKNMSCVLEVESTIERDGIKNLSIYWILCILLPVTELFLIQSLNRELFLLFCALSLYSASHLRVAQENAGLQKEQKCNTFAFVPVMKCGCVFWEFAKMKLATRKDKIR